jgi:hypothetical protein
LNLDQTINDPLNHDQSLSDPLNPNQDSLEEDQASNEVSVRSKSCIQQTDKSYFYYFLSYIEHIRPLKNCFNSKLAILKLCM